MDERLFVLCNVFPEACKFAAFPLIALLDHLAGLGINEQLVIIKGVPLVIGIAGYIPQLARWTFHIQAIHLPDSLYIVAGVLVRLIGFGFPAAAASRRACGAVHARLIVQHIAQLNLVNLADVPFAADTAAYFGRKPAFLTARVTVLSSLLDVPECE